MNQTEIDGFLQGLTESQIANIFWHVKGFVGANNRKLINDAIESALIENHIIEEVKQYRKVKP